MEKEKFQTLLTLMANRRSIRQYTAEPIDDNLLSVLLEKAARTQTMGNLQLYSVVVTRNEEMKQRLAPFHFNQPMVTAAPVVLTFCADYHRTSAWCRERHATPGYDNFLFHQCRHRCATFLPDILHTGRSGRPRSLLSRHNRLQSRRHHRHTASARTRYAGSFHHLGLSCRKTGANRPAATNGFHAR